MCCLFGILDYKHSLSNKQMTRMLNVLSTACEARGTDATGIAYNSNGKLAVYKRPLPAHKMNFKLPYGVHYVMGHTRLATQGSEEMNYNNHPFLGKAGTDFALAHNGVIYNDVTLRNKEELPATKIMTDSYIAVQLIESQKKLSFDSLKYMAEKLRGSFTITVLDKKDNLYIVKGDNPMCLYHFPKKGIYVYASTEAILNSGLSRLGFYIGNSEKISVIDGAIIKIDKDGAIDRSRFDDSFLWDSWSYYSDYGWSYGKHYKRYRDYRTVNSAPTTTQISLNENDEWEDITGSFGGGTMTDYDDVSDDYEAIDGGVEEVDDDLSEEEVEYIEHLKTVARFLGYSNEDVETWLKAGNSYDDIESFLYEGAR